jgi:hypothetical protein
LVETFFSKCGIVVIILPLVAALFFVAGCLERSSYISNAIPEDQTGARALCPSGLHVDFDSEVCSSLFSIRGSLTPLGNGSFPYLLLNATLRREGLALKSTKYLMIGVKSGGDHFFEIAKNMFLPSGDYSCTLEVSGPTGILACETRGCKTREPWTEPSSVPTGMPDKGRSIGVADERLSFQQDDGRVGSDEVDVAPKRESGAERGLGGTKGEATRAEGQESSSQGSGLQVSPSQGLASQDSESQSSPSQGSGPQVSPSQGLASQDSESQSSPSQGSGPQVSPSQELASQDSESQSQVPEGQNASRDRVESSAKKVAGTDAKKKYDGSSADADAMRADASEGTKDVVEKFVGSSSSKKYHRLDCRYAQKIKPENRIYFSSEEDAKSEGYLPCKVCAP